MTNFVIKIALVLAAAAAVTIVSHRMWTGRIPSLRFVAVTTVVLLLLVLVADRIIGW